jgi:hypothetical protein
VSIWGPSEIGNRWATPPTTTQSRSQAIVRSDAPLNLGTLSVSDGSISSEKVREQLQTASGPLRTAFAAFTRHTNPVFTTNISTRPAVAGALAGTAARVTSIAGSYSVVQTTVKANTQTSTVRSSASAIGLDLTAAHSRLASAALGLDVTSPEAASTLRSTAGLGLNVVDAASTLSSTAEMNGAATSLGNSSLAVSGSTSRVEISGAYTGTATSLTFKMTRSATVNEGGLFGAHVTFNVLDQNHDVVESYNGNIHAGEVIDLSDIGLKVRFTEGTLAKDGTGTTTVAQTPTSINTTAAFDAAWGSAPLFENFSQVSSGSFNVNGVTIAVNASDSIDSVLARINGSAAGVTAAAVNDRIVLTSNSPSESNIVVGNDTSGFLQATKLLAAATSRGNIRDDQQILSQTTQFGSVASGSFTVNGVSIAIDKNTDSLATVLSRISSAGAGVNASYDAAQGKVILSTTGNSEDVITLSGDTTGFVVAAQLSTATTVVGNVRDDLQVLSRTSQFGAVDDGTFQVNGATIAIDVDQDSLSTVIQKINDANAGVVASFNAATSRVELESVGDSEDQIAVNGDSTGLLAIAGLSTGNTVVGSIADDRQALSETAAFAGVTAGTFAINGVAIAIDPDADSLQDVLARVNSAGAGVTATYDSATDRLVLTPLVAGANLSVEDDTTGFLAAARVAEGTAGTQIDPDAAFDGSTGNGPLFDPGFSVQAGSFVVNGVTIAVAADDTVNTVLSRINASGAGVAATFDAATQLLRMTSTQHSASSISLGGDTSGFLAAMKLDGTAQSTTGRLARGAFDAAIGSFSEYGAVSAGTLTINGQQISIDPASTTMRGLMAALDGVTGIDADLDESSGRIRVWSTQSGGAIEVTDTSGILGSLGISAGTYSGSAGRTVVTETQSGISTVSNSADVASNVHAAAEEFTAALTELAVARAGDDRFLKRLVDAATDAVASLRDAGVGGLTVGGEGTDVRFVVDRDALASALDAMSDPRALAGVVAATLDEFAARVAEAVAAPAPSKPVPDAQSQSLVRPVTANQAAAALLFQKALERVQGTTDERSNDDAADGALDLETRMRIRAQLEMLEEPTSYAGNLLDSLVTNSR